MSRAVVDLPQSELSEAKVSQGRTHQKPYLRQVTLCKRSIKLLRLLYAAHAHGDEPVAKAVDRIKTVERLVKQKIVIRQTRGRWRPVVEEIAQA